MVLSSFSLILLILDIVLTSLSLYFAAKLLFEQEGLKTAFYGALLANVVNFFIKIGADFFTPYINLLPLVASIPLTLAVWVVIIRSIYRTDFLKATIISIVQVIIVELVVEFGLLNLLTSYFGIYNVPINVF